MGYRGHDDWRDMSDYAVHFTKPISDAEIGDPPAPPKRKGQLGLGELVAKIEYEGRKDRSGYSPWISILGAGKLRPGSKPLGVARQIPELIDHHCVVCFSEIPLDMLDRLIERRSLYGVGFRKDFLVARGGAPLWYLDKDSPQGQLVYDLVQSRAREEIDPEDPLWRLTPFIDNPGNYKGKQYRFEWEREWRVVGELDFEPDDVTFLFLPEDEHEKARQFFADVEIEHSGPAYHCAYIDPRWEIDRIQDALTNVPEVPPPSPSAVPWWADP